MRTLSAAFLLSLYAFLFAGTLAAVNQTPDDPPKRIVVPAGATGDDLLKAIETVAENGEVVVGAGTFYINQSILISKSFTLQGSGMEKTRLVLEAEGIIIQFVPPKLPIFRLNPIEEDGSADFSESQHGNLNADADQEGISILMEPSENVRSHNWFAARDIHFDYKGTSPNNVITAYDGQLRFYRCKFSGGANQYEGGRLGNGVALFGGTQTLLSECAFLENARNGILAFGDASVRIISCRFENNLSGIAIVGSARGEVRNSSCCRNTGSGILAADQSHLTVIGSVCSQNGTGIALGGSAHAELQNNECSDNTYTGIVASAQSRLVARSNRCSRNRFGIALDESARGEIRDNKCTDNVYSGIIARGQSHLIAENNQCEENGVGIGLFSSAQAKLIANTCLNNRFGDIVYQQTVKTNFSGNIGKVEKFENLNTSMNQNRVSSQSQSRKKYVPKRSSGKRARTRSNR
jgi:parallel beta-helix repeat protein